MKHVLSKESQELFNKLSSALTDETNIEWQNAALAAIKTEPGIHQLTTYLLSFIAEKVTHSMKNLFVLEQMMKATEALLNNQSIYLDPYIAYMVPPVLTCCTGKNLGPVMHHAPSNASSETLNGNGVNGYGPTSFDHFKLRDHAASILSRISQKHSASSSGLKSRIARTCLKQFMDFNKTLGTHYGALRALLSITGIEGLKMIILPNLKMYMDDFLAAKLADESTRREAERVVEIFEGAFKTLNRTRQAQIANGTPDLESMRERLSEKIGDVFADLIISRKWTEAAQFTLQADVSI